MTGTAETAGSEARLHRAFLARVLEPGDEVGGRWLRESGPRRWSRRLTGGGQAAAGVTDKRWAGLRARAERADPERDLAVARDAGTRFVCPGDAEWPAQLDDLGDARPIGLWVRGRPSLRIWALRSVAVVGARACTEYGAHMASDSARGSPSGAGSWCPGAPTGWTARRTEVRSARAGPPWRSSRAGSTGPTRAGTPN